MKDAFWFKHDSNALRDQKMMMLKHIYDFWGIGLYWSVIEFLREQDGYRFKNDNTSLDLVCSLVMCLDNVRFHNWFKDCIRFGLFVSDNGYFFSTSLLQRMKNWETLKANGSKGGRPSKPEKKPGVKPEKKPGVKPLDILDKNIIYTQSFEFYKSETDKAKTYNDEMSKAYLIVANHICLKNQDGSWRLPAVLRMKNQLSLSDFNKLYEKVNGNMDKIIPKIDSLQTNVKYHGKYTDLYLTINKWITNDNKTASR